MDSLKFKKNCTPFRSLVSSRGAVNYGVAKDLANILRPLVGQSTTTSGTSNISWSTSKPSNSNGGMHFIL